ncbi:hypothetical protein F4778DRAFT_650254 [Xylariomycetidae sp. FL2044]|nr:hypothetical protein F4778DRAFT_650254 [Xylariomycetidae sp. FL2044]
MTKPEHLQASQLGTKEYWDTLYAHEITNHAHDPNDRGTVWFDDSDAENRIIEFLTSSPEGDEEEEQDDEEQGEDEDPEYRNTPLDLDMDTTSFLDLGTGNGSLLYGLRDAGFRGPMLGVDYSPASVELARRIGRSRRRRSCSRSRREGEEVDGEVEEKGEGEEVEKEKGEEEEEEEVYFQTYDILNSSPSTLSLPLSSPPQQQQQQQQQLPASSPPPPPPPPPPPFDVLLDKGTFDAISLASSSSSPPEPTESPISSSTDQPPSPRQRQRQQQRRRYRPNELYKSRVLPLLCPGGLFLITSCNWTEEELRAWFEEEDEEEEEEEQEEEKEKEKQEEEKEKEKQEDMEWGFRVVGRVKYPSFSFGGVKGQTISTMCFRKVRRRVGVQVR